MNLTPDALQSLSVKVVTMFMNKQASLSDAVAEVSLNQSLNPEQIKRLIEASNSIAYLRQLQSTSDRTFEFPVAEYNQVLSKMALPESLDTSPTTSPQVVEKQAEAQDFNFDFSEQEKVAMLAREVIGVKGGLEKMAFDKEELTYSLLQASGRLSKDPLALEKLTHVADEDSFKPLSSLLGKTGFEKSASVKEPAFGHIFKSSELKEAEALCGLYKQAVALLAKEKEMSDFYAKGLEILEKKAFLNPIAGAGWLIGKGITGAKNFATSTSKALINRSQLNKAVHRAQHINPKATKQDVLDKWHADAAIGGREVATKMNKFKPTPFAKMGVGTGLTLATAPLTEHKTNVWDTLHPKQY